MHFSCLCGYEQVVWFIWILAHLSKTWLSAPALYSSRVRHNNTIQHLAPGKHSNEQELTSPCFDEQDAYTMFIFSKGWWLQLYKQIFRASPLLAAFSVPTMSHSYPSIIFGISHLDLNRPNHNSCLSMLTEHAPGPMKSSPMKVPS